MNSIITRARLILWVALFCPCFSVSAESIHLQLRWHHRFQFAGYYAAVEKGYYKKAGLDVIIHHGTPEKTPVNEVILGISQYGVAHSELLLERLRGAPLVKVFLEASLDGWRYAMAHRQEIIDLLLNKYKVTKSREHLEFEAEAMHLLILPDLMELGHMNPWRWHHMAGTFVQAGMVKNDHLLQGFFYTPESGIDSEKLSQYLKVIATVAIILSFIALILYKANQKIKQENRRRIAIEKELRKRTNELALNNQILQQINQGITLPKLLDEFICQVEALHPGMLCSILLVDKEGKHLLLGAGPSLPDFYNQAVNGMSIGDGIGSCGTAAYRNERVIVENIQEHPYWESFRDLAKLADIQSCWSQPINNSKGEVLGTFAIHHRQPARPSDAEITLIENYATLAQLGIEHNLAETALIESEERLRFVLEGSELGFWDWRIDINEVERDPVWAEILGYSHEEIKHTTQEWTDFIYPHDREKVWQSIQDVLDGCSPIHKIEYRMIHKDGSLRWILDRAKVVQRDQHGRPIRMSGTHADITERKAAEEELRIAAIAFESQEGMIVCNSGNVIIKVNQAFTSITGYTAKEAVGQTPQHLLRSGRQETAFYTAMWNRINHTGAWQGEIWNRRKNGEVYPEWLTITVVKGIDGAITHFVATLTDITERKTAEEKIKQLAFYDPLTHLPNRRLLLDRLKHSIDMERREGNKLALLMIDLDRFKIVNDSLGHLAGDELLKQVASRIKRRLRDLDTVARLGGDEFIILLEDIAHPEDAARVAEEIIADLSRPFQLNQYGDAGVGASIGISLYPQHGDSPEKLMNNADTALYQAKDCGRGGFAYFSEELTLATRRRLALETQLRLAIEQRELRVYYQPQIDIARGRIIGAEALVRWQSSSEELFLPKHFIPIAEESSLIMDIGAWVLRETCRQGRQWLDQGLPAVILSVNVSPHQFRYSNINDLVATVLSETGFPAGQLALEITEKGLLEHQDKAMDILNNLHVQGVGLAIDDFGTGYSSLACLKYFPLDVLKIDKSFIEDIPFLQGNMEITATIIAMAHTLGFKVLAEGVETSEQLVFLHEHGCDRYQGYLNNRALPAETFAELLRKS